MLNTAKREPLPIGAQIEFCGMLASVVEDDGGDRITVRCEGAVQRWYWRFEGVECTIVKH